MLLGCLECTSVYEKAHPAAPRRCGGRRCAARGAAAAAPPPPLCPRGRRAAHPALPFQLPADLKRSDQLPQAPILLPPTGNRALGVLAVRRGVNICQKQAALCMQSVCACMQQCIGRKAGAYHASLVGLHAARRLRDCSVACGCERLLVVAHVFAPATSPAKQFCHIRRPRNLRWLMLHTPLQMWHR